MIAEKHKPRIVIGTASIIFIGIILLWAYTTPTITDVQQAFDENFLSTIFRQRTAEMNALRDAASTTPTTTP